MHLLRSASIPDLNSRLREADARRVLEKVNGIWRQAALQFYPETILVEEAGGQPLYRALGPNRTEGHLRLVRPRASRSDQMFHLYYLGRMRPNGITLDGSYETIFVKDGASLMEVPGGIDEPLPRVSAHEIGHGLGLEHREDLVNLMASGTTGTGLNDAEVRQARAAAAQLPWCLTPGGALSLADRLAEEKPSAAAAIYATLARLPEGEISSAARNRLAALPR
jgi:hypothetical protein